MSEDTPRKNTKKKQYHRTMYTPSLCEDIIVFFDKPHFQEINGKNYPSPLPTVEKFCSMHCISKKTFHTWVNKHPEFKESYMIAKNFQAEQLINLSLMGFYKEGFAKLIAYNVTDLKSEAHIMKEAGYTKDEDIPVLTLNYNVTKEVGSDQKTIEDKSNKE